jgi:DMSO/TMAO reductase YedYZ molybdopterin-dependent catalytic subunit
VLDELPVVRSERRERALRFPYDLVTVLAMAVAFLAQSAIAQPAASLEIAGNVAQPQSIALDEIRKLPAQRFEDARGDGKGGGSPRRYTGVLLRDVLDRAKPIERAPRGLRKSYIVASASDGYRVVFSWAELYLSPIGEGVFVVYERDGAPLSESEGPLALVSLKDTSPGPRHVKWLKSIEVRAIVE